MKTVFKLAFRNFVAYRKLYIRLTIAFVALIFLITLVSCFTMSVNELQTDMINDNISQSYIWEDEPIDTSGIEQKFKMLELTKWNINDYVRDILGFNMGYVSSLNIGIIYDGQIVPCRANRYTRFEVYATDDWENVFTPNDYKEAGKNAQFMVGRFPESPNEVVVSQYYLEGCGLTTDDLGAKLTFGIVKYKTEKPDDGTSEPPKLELNPGDWNSSTSGETSEPPEPEIDEIIPITQELTVCGIFLADYYELNGRSYSGFCPIVMFDKSNMAENIGQTETYYMCSLDGWANKTTADYIKQADLYYLGDGSLYRINITGNLKMVVNRLGLYFGSALVLGIIISAFLLVEKLCAASVKNSGILLISGFTDKQTFLVMLVQILFTSIVSFVIAIVITFVAMREINNILHRTFWIRFSVSTAVYFAVAAIGLAIVAALSVVTLAYVAVKRRGKQTRELLDV